MNLELMFYKQCLQAAKALVRKYPSWTGHMEDIAHEAYYVLLKRLRSGNIPALEHEGQSYLYSKYAVFNNMIKCSRHRAIISTPEYLPEIDNSDEEIYSLPSLPLGLLAPHEAWIVRQVLLGYQSRDIVAGCGIDPSSVSRIKLKALNILKAWERGEQIKEHYSPEGRFCHFLRHSKPKIPNFWETDLPPKTQVGLNDGKKNARMQKSPTHLKSKQAHPWKGVEFTPQKTWKVYFRDHGKRISASGFTSAEDAATVYNFLAYQARGMSTYFNTVPQPWLDNLVN
jgi:hypothetical protein